VKEYEAEELASEFGRREEDQEGAGEGFEEEEAKCF